MFKGAAVRFYSVYFLKSGQHIKIGVSNNVNSRIQTLQTGNPHEFELIGAIPQLARTQAFEIESKFHHYFRSARKQGEWFHLPNFDCYDHDTETIIYGDGGLHLNTVIGN